MDLPKLYHKLTLFEIFDNMEKGDIDKQIIFTDDVAIMAVRGKEYVKLLKSFYDYKEES